MAIYDSHDVERKVVSILKVLSESQEPLGARVIARHLEGYGVDLSERAVRYHLKIMDERGLTQSSGRDGRLITELGLEELKNALVTDKVGFIIETIESLAFRTTFDPKARVGQVVMNTSLFLREEFEGALQAMKDAMRAGLCVSDLVAVAYGGERLGEVIVPREMVGLGTVCSITINGVLLKAGVPMDSRFGGILQIRNHRPMRFVDLIYYNGSSLDPSEAFISAGMTAVSRAAREGEGKILANFREIPALCRDMAVEVVAHLKEAGIGGMLLLGKASEPVCQIPVGLNRVGMILLGGLNPVAAAGEAGFKAKNKAMSTLVDFHDLINFWELV